MFRRHQPTDIVSNYHVLVLSCCKQCTIPYLTAHYTRCNYGKILKRLYTESALMHDLYF